VRLEISEPRTPQPLTRENLRILTRTMTPALKSVDTTITKSKPDAASVRRRLRENGLLIDDDKGLETHRGELIVDYAKKMITSERLSPKSEELLRKWAKKIKKEELSNEATFINVMWWILVRDDRTVKKTAEEQEDADDKVMRRDWDMDHLKYRLDQEFTRGYIPTLDPAENEELSALLSKMEGVTNPKPDLAYGLDEDAFDEIASTANALHKDLTELSDQMYHTFFIAEFKSHKGSVAEAKNQACRGGAVLMNTIAMLREKAGISDKDDAFDHGSFTFSLAFDPYSAFMYVHWREIRGPKEAPKTFYHMDQLGQYALREKQPVEDLRIAINNVLEWGVGARKTFVLDMLAKIAEKARAQAKAASKSSGNTKDSSSQGGTRQSARVKEQSEKKGSSSGGGANSRA